MNKDENDPAELVKDFLRIKGYTKTLENLEAEEKQKRQKVIEQLKIT